MTPVFYYHRVGPFREGAPRKMTVTPENFRRQMEFLCSWSAAVLTLDQVLEGRKGAALTFDDGFKDCMEFALPVLLELKLTAAFFIVAGRVGGSDTWMRVTAMPEERIMDWDDLKRLRDAGMTIGSHTMTHTTLSSAELGDSKRLLEEKLGLPIRHFAYPRGEYAPGDVEGVKQAGYGAAWATKGGDAGTFTRRRLPVSANAGLLQFGGKVLKAKLGFY